MIFGRKEQAKGLSIIVDDDDVDDDDDDTLALQSIEGQGLPADFWPHVHLSAERGTRLFDEQIKIIDIT